MVKKNNSGFWIAQFWCPNKDLGLTYDFGSTWVRNRREKSDFYEFSFSANEPLRNGKKTIQAFELLNSYVRPRI